MNISFKKWFSSQLNESEPNNHIMQAIINSIQSLAHQNPFLSHLANDKKELAEFLKSFYYLNPPVKPTDLNSPQGMQSLLQRMTQDYMSRSPELSQAKVQQAYDKRWGTDQKTKQEPGYVANPARTPAGRKILELTISLANRLGHDPKPYTDVMVNLMSQNSQEKVEQWATQLNTPEELHRKLLDWKNRGVI